MNGKVACIDNREKRGWKSKAVDGSCRRRIQVRWVGWIAAMWEIWIAARWEIRWTARLWSSSRPMY